MTRRHPAMRITQLALGGLLLVLAIDNFLDMGRSATNVLGNAIASSVVARWEGVLGPETAPEVEPPHAPSRGLDGDTPVQA